jgi:hypothetical protein
MSKHKFFAVVMFFSAAGCFAAGIDVTKWRYVCPIDCNGAMGGYCSAEVTPEIYDCARGDLADIRIVGKNGQQVPYLILRSQDINGREKFTPAVLNSVTAGDKSAKITLDFGSQQMKNSIEVSTLGSNFRRAVKVEGSNDNIEFFTLVEHAFVFAIYGHRDVSRFETIDLPANDYRYLRVTVYRMAEENKPPIINNVSVYKDEKKPAPRIEAPMRLLNYRNDDVNGLSVYEYDLESRNLPVVAFEFLFADEFFYRYMMIEGRDAIERKVKIYGEDNRERFKIEEEPWSSLAGGTVYRYVSADGKICENRTVSIWRAYRYLRVTIRNYDDKPLTVQSAMCEMIPHRVIFDFSGGGDLALYCGNPSAAKPQYDINYKVGDATAVKTTDVKLGALAENSFFSKTAQKPVAWTEKHKMLLTIILGAVVLILGVFMFKSFRDIKPTESV